MPLPLRRSFHPSSLASLRFASLPFLVKFCVLSFSALPACYSFRIDEATLNPGSPSEFALLCSAERCHRLHRCIRPVSITVMSQRVLLPQPPPGLCIHAAACMRAPALHRRVQTRQCNLQQQAAGHASLSSRPASGLYARRRRVVQACASSASGAASVSTQSMDDGAAQRSPLMNDIFGGLTSAIVALP